MNTSRILLLALLILCLLSLPLIAQTSDPISNNESSSMEDTEFEAEEEGLEGFGDEGGFQNVEVDIGSIDTSALEESFFEFGGFIKEEIDYSYAYEEDSDFSKIKTTLNLSLDFKFLKSWRASLNWNGFYDYSYEYRDREEFTDETLETYESESEIRDAFIDGGITDWLRIKLGRQIIAWGQSDSAQITDMANPRDLRELGMVDLEDARLPVTASKLSLLFGSLEFNAIAIHEVRGNKMPAKGSEFDVYQDVRNAGIVIEDEEVPENGGENTEYLVRFFKTFNGGDFGIMWADTFEDYPFLEFEELSVVNLVPSLKVVPKHKRIQTVGLSGNIVTGDWLFKIEVARKTGVAYSRNDIESQLSDAVSYTASAYGGSAVYDDDSDIVETWIEKDSINGMIGMEYSGIQDITITLEAVGEKIEDYEETLNSKEVSGQYVLIISHSAFNDTLDSQLFWIHFTDDNGDVYRVNIAYDLIDALEISGGFINYEATEEDASVYNFRNNDRVFLSLKYSF